jgi:hypothetical protein
MSTRIKRKGKDYPGGVIEKSGCAVEVEPDFEKVSSIEPFWCQFLDR